MATGMLMEKAEVSINVHMKNSASLWTLASSFKTVFL